MLVGQYALDAMYCSVTEAFTNAVPTEPYRGAGRPEASYVIERLATLAARELDMDPAEFRRRNYIPSEAFPYETPAGYTYDSGDYEKPLDEALSMVSYDDLRERQAELREEGRYLGIGISSYVESCGYGPSEIVGQIGGQMGLWENGLVRFHPSGTVTVYCGTSGHGQGHQTTYAQIVADELGIPYDDIEVIEGDTDEVPMGMGTYGSRSVTVGGAAPSWPRRRPSRRRGTSPPIIWRPTKPTSSLRRVSSTSLVLRTVRCRFRRSHSRRTSLTTCPTASTLCIHGEEDVFEIERAAETADKLPNGSLTAIPQAGRLSNLERPGAVNEALGEFLDNVSRNA